MTAPSILRVTKRSGIAGEYGFTATVQYDGEEPESVTFTRSIYGPPIVMVTAGLPGGVFVSERVLDRIGSKLDEAWVRAFFGPRDEERCCECGSASHTCDACSVFDGPED